MLCEYHEVYRALTYQYQSNNKKAIEHYDEAIELKPDYVEAYYIQSRHCLLQEGRYGTCAGGFENLEALAEKQGLSDLLQHIQKRLKDIGSSGERFLTDSIFA